MQLGDNIRRNLKIRICLRFIYLSIHSPICKCLSSVYYLPNNILSSGVRNLATRVICGPISLAPRGAYQKCRNSGSTWASQIITHFQKDLQLFICTLMLGKYHLRKQDSHSINKENNKINKNRNIVFYLGYIEKDSFIFQ